MSEEEKKKMYYGGKEKKAGEIRKATPTLPEDWVRPMPYWSREAQTQFEKMMEQFEKDYADFWETPPMFKHRHRLHHVPGFPMMPSEETMPSVDLEDKGKEYRLTADLPGFNKEDIEVEVQDDSVIIQAQKAQTEEEKKKNYVRRERRARSFYRRMPLPENVKAEEAKASLVNGMLEITLPKKEPKETKKLTIM